MKEMPGLYILYIKCRYICQFTNSAYKWYSMLFCALE